MEENKDYHAYRYGDHLTPGSELKIEHSVVCENVDISTLITMGIDSLEAMRQGSIDGGSRKPMKSWWLLQNNGNSRQRQHRRSTGLWNIFVHRRLNIPATSGKTPITGGADQKISNRVYQMTCSIWEDTKYDRETKQSVPIAWYVTYGKSVFIPRSRDMEQRLPDKTRNDIQIRTQP